MTWKLYTANDLNFGFTITGEQSWRYIVEPDFSELSRVEAKPETNILSAGRLCAQYILVVAMLILGNAFPDNGAHAESKSRIVFLGDSLTAGLGLSEEQAFPGLIRKHLLEKNLPFEVVNAGVGGDTTAGGLRRLPWLLEQPVDVLVVALGGNDGLRGVEPESIGNNLREIIALARSKNPNVRILLFGMYVPPSMGGPYVRNFADIFSRVAEETKVTFRPFLLEGVAGFSHLNIEDGIHPNAKGHRKIADSVWAALQPLLEQISGRPLDDGGVVGPGQ